MEEEWWNGGKKGETRRDETRAFDRLQLSTDVVAPSFALLGNDDPCLALFIFSGT